MNFNKYIWELYKNSKHGMETIRIFSEEKEKLKRETENLKITFEPFEQEYIDKYGSEKFDVDVLDVVIKYAQNRKIDNIEEATKLFEEIAANGLPITYPDNKGNVEKIGDLGGEKNEYKIYEAIRDISLGLYFAHSEYFIPYFFSRDGFNNLVHPTNE